MYRKICIWRNWYHLAKHSGNVGRTLVVIAYIVCKGKIYSNQIVVLSIYKHTKPASQFIMYVPTDQIGPNLVSLIRNLGVPFTDKLPEAKLPIHRIVMDVKICEKCRI